MRGTEGTMPSKKEALQTFMDGVSLSRRDQERASSKQKKENTFERQKVPSLPYDIIFKILLLIPAESLQRLRLVCKAWFHMINSSNFVEAHTNQSENILTFLTAADRRPRNLCIKAKLGLPEEKSIFSGNEPPRSYIDFFEIQDGRGKIRETRISGFEDILATCNGLILATCECYRGLLVINPETRKLARLPLGTIASDNDPRNVHHGARRTRIFSSDVESYGLLFSHSTGEYKVGHLFLDGSEYIGCEILSLTTRRWKAVDGPSLGLLTNFIYTPVAAIGALHWLPRTHGTSYFVSLSMDEEEFYRTPLPISNSHNDRLLAIGGFLSFVTHVTPDKIEVWILKGLLHGEDWLKWHIITGYQLIHLIPISPFKNGKGMVFIRHGTSCFHTYDFELEVMRTVEMDTENMHQNDSSYLPHVSSLVTWEAHQALW